MAIETRILQNKTVFGEWEVKEFIGSGSGGKTAVFRIVRRHGEWEESAALKVINILEETGKKENLEETYRQEYDAERTELCQQAVEEIRLMSHLRGNPYIVEYYDFLFVDYQESYVFGTDLLIRMELLESLREERKKKGEYQEEEVIRIGKDICRGLSSCHQAGIIHRDIKPDNIFVTAWGDYKLGDFGIARMVDAGQKASTKMGTRAYAAPEQFMSYQAKYDKRVDIYSLGLTLYELLNHNRLPFAESSYVRESEIQLRIMGEALPAPENANPALAVTIQKACAYKAQDRYDSVDQFMEALMAAEVGVLSKESRSVFSKEQKPVQEAENKEDGKGEKKSKAAWAALVAVGIGLVLLMVLIPIGIYMIHSVPAEQTEDGSEEYEEIFGKAAYVTLNSGRIAVITEDGTLYTWEKNRGGDVSKPVRVMDNVASVYLTDTHTAALTKEGDLYVLGENISGSQQATPQLILSGVKQVFLGKSQSGALCNDGNLYGWGFLYGNGSGSMQGEPTLIASNIVNFSMNEETGGAVTENGELYMWGSNWGGQVGNGQLEDQPTPVKIMDKVASIQVGDYMVAAITQDGDLYAWGYNGYGEVGNDSRITKITEPVKILSNVRSVYLEAHQSAAITNSGSLYMWGCNDNCQLGLPYLRYGAPEFVCTEVESVVLGERHTAIIRTNGDLYLCGENTNKQISDSDLLRIRPPMKVAEHIISVGLGWDFTYAVGEDGSFYVWGE